MQLSSILAGGAAVCGFIAAVCWYRSTKAELLPEWSGEGASPMNSPMAEILAQHGWIDTVSRSLNHSAQWNRWGAIWTGVSVLLSGLASAASAFGN